MEVQAASAASNHETKGGALNTDIWFLMFKAVRLEFTFCILCETSWVYLPEKSMLTLFSQLVEDVENSHYRMGKDEFELYAWLRSLRLLSRDFNTIITPLVYADISLTNYWRMWWLIDPYTSDYDAVKVFSLAISILNPMFPDFRFRRISLHIQKPSL
jgi:hypothetical protein